MFVPGRTAFSNSLNMYDDHPGLWLLGRGDSKETSDSILWKLHHLHTIGKPDKSRFQELHPFKERRVLTMF